VTRKETGGQQLSFRQKHVWNHMESMSGSLNLMWHIVAHTLHRSLILASSFQLDVGV
jgi:hypothetical protein